MGWGLKKDAGLMGQRAKGKITVENIIYYQ
jgi:hypothetical protein